MSAKEGIPSVTSTSLAGASSLMPATHHAESEMNQTLYTAFDGLNQHHQQQLHQQDGDDLVFAPTTKAPAPSCAPVNATIVTAHNNSSSSSSSTHNTTTVTRGAAEDHLATPVKVLNLSTDSGTVTLRHQHTPGSPVNASHGNLSDTTTPYAVRRPTPLLSSPAAIGGAGSQHGSSVRGLNYSGTSLNSSLDTNASTVTSTKFASEETPVADRHYIVCSRLDNCTTKKMLLDLFFPYGALDARMLTNTSSVTGINSTTSRRTGFVVFSSMEMARLARDKMHQFIPCRQTLALIVHTCTLAEVKDAMHRDSFAASLDLDMQGARPQGNTAKLGLLADMAGTTSLHLSNYIKQTADPDSTAQELVNELDVASQSKIGKYAEALKLIGDMWPDAWPHRKHLQTSLVRGLLSAILQSGSNTSGAQEELAPLHQVDHGPRRVNSGHLLGLLFINGFIPGDPYEVATRLLRSEIAEVSQITAICKIVELNPPSQFPKSSSVFWALIAEITATHTNPEIRFSCSQRLTSRFVERPHLSNKGLSPDAKPFQTSSSSRGHSPISEMGSANSPLGGSPLGGSPMLFPGSVPGGSPFSGSFTGLPPSSSIRNTPQGKKAEEARSRTVYVSRLSPSAPAFRFREMLDQCGVVNRVRVCREQGYSTLFGFVELHSKEAARALLRRDKELFYDSQVRFQPAKMPVQDEDSGDAQIGPEGQRLRLCDFALHHPQSTSVAMLAAYMKARK